MYGVLTVSNVGGGYPGPPPAAPMDVSNLIHQLVDHGMIDNSQNESRGLGRSSPATVPTLGFTSATLKQLVHKILCATLN